MLYTFYMKAKLFVHLQTLSRGRSLGVNCLMVTPLKTTFFLNVKSHVELLLTLGVLLVAFVQAVVKGRIHGQAAVQSGSY